MNSQIYCLPQKFGWNALPDVGPLYPSKTGQRLNAPYFRVNLDCQPVSLDLSGPDSLEKAKAAVNISETAYRFQPIYLYNRIKSPATLEKKANPLTSGRQFEPPMKKLMKPGPSYHDDSDRGLHFWRSLEPLPCSTIWQPFVKRDWTKESGERTTLPPVRLSWHDPKLEKERWEYIRNLSRNDAIAYRYRREIAGYTGYKPNEQDILSEMERDLAHPNPAMESTTQATHKEFAASDYHLSPRETANRHQGPMSRMVTLTHPYNPYTQQSAYCNVGATGTQ